MTNRYYRMSALGSTPLSKGLLPVSPATIWRWVNQGHFPKPVKLGPMLTVWRSEDVERFLEGAAEQIKASDSTPENRKKSKVTQ